MRSRASGPSRTCRDLSVHSTCSPASISGRCLLTLVSVAYAAHRARWYPGTRLDPRGRSATSFYGVTEEHPSDTKQHSNHATDDNPPEHSDDKTTADGVLDGVYVDPVGHFRQRSSSSAALVVDGLPLRSAGDGTATRLSLLACPSSRRLTNPSRMCRGASVRLDTAPADITAARQSCSIACQTPEALPGDHRRPVSVLCVLYRVLCAAAGLIYGPDGHNRMVVQRRGGNDGGAV